MHLVLLLLACGGRGVDTGSRLAPVDGDGDGYTSDVDCDDGSAAIFPGGLEICDGLDNDCDGEVDEGLGSYWYLDTDQDGFGDPSQARASCERPADTVPNDEDCDDSDPDTHPGAPELCDGHDNDCDGVVDLCADLGLADGVWLGSESGQGAGTSVAGVGDVNGDGLDDLLVGSPGDSEGGSGAGSVSLVLGPGTGEHRLSDAAAVWVGESSGAQAGYAVSGAGDVDGDGWADLLVGAWGDVAAGSSAGAVYVLSGPASGSGSLSDATAKLLGGLAGDSAGIAVAAGGDSDGDGYDDVLVGAPNQDHAGESGGAAYLVRGPLYGERTLSSASLILYGEAAADQAGARLAGGQDLDGDGLDDLAVGAYGNDLGGSGAGAVYVVHGPVSGALSLASADARLRGEAAGDHAGSSVAMVRDMDGDGLADLALGAPDENSGDTSAGAIYLVYQVPSGSADVGEVAGAKVFGRSVGDHLGASLSSAGDVDADGLGDLIVGAYMVSVGGVNAGAAALVLGPVSGLHYLGDSDPQLNGAAEGDKAGWSVGGDVDLDGDGQDDLLVGAPKHADGVGTTVGAGYVVLGGRL